MTAVAEQAVLAAAELDLAVDSVADEIAPTAADPEANVAKAAEQPFIEIIKGAPTDAEVAALVCVLSAAARDAAPAARGPLDMWGRPTMMHRGSSPFSPYAFPQLSHLRD
ncbi:acyl-CoA carboxylase subunit epsilon [Nocardia panacis]|uniref:Acyl-CoA carboxylase subunit epsilon n=1 Tax=Nocardia panacis TaxID=2340916 RepID=A0A3A4K5E6_9NOCA|nr:acyl-CoA carboxylase subunit epsilon [Nocardia panacis]RJO72285.1 acyl-CoA carboxylase subunit epsilon [Nocardia panacis]